MPTSILLIGAAGRMGRAMRELIRNDPEFVLAGQVDGDLAKLDPAEAVTGSSLAEVLDRCPGAVIVDFTAPAAAMEHVRLAAERRVPAVVGTTGFTDEQLAEMRSLAENSPVFRSANMSVGVNALARVLPELARCLGADYDMEMVELHHDRKKDSPSGTALLLGECLAEARGWNLSDVRCSARDGIIGERPKTQIGVQAIRGGDVVGVHTVFFLGTGESVEVTHRAQSRDTFAQGALRAAAWLRDRPGGRLYSMRDVF